MDDDHIYLDYDGQLYPYCYVTNYNKLTGAYVELWKLIARLMKKQVVWTMNGGDGPAEDGQMSPTQKRIYDGHFLTHVDTNFYDFEDSLVFKASSPFSYTKGLLYERQRGSEREQTDLVFFTVFGWDSILLIIAALIIVSLLSSLQLRRNRGRWDAANVLLTLSNVLNTLGVTLLVYHHAAGFRGNNVVLSPPTAPSFEEAVLSIRSGQRSLLLSGDAELYVSQVQFITGNRSTSEVPRTNDALYALCADQTLFAPFFSSQLLAMNLVNNSCKLSGIEQGLVRGERMPYDQHYGIDDPAYFLFAKNTTRKTMELVNKVVLRLFQQDHIENVWTARYMQSLRMLDFSSPVMQLEYRPFNLSRLSILFFVFIGSIPLQVGAFVVEIIAYRLKRLR